MAKKAGIIIFLFMLGVILFFPPWEFYVNNKRVSFSEVAGNHFIFNPPKSFKYPASRLDWDFLALQVFCAIFVSCIVALSGGFFKKTSLFFRRLFSQKVVVAVFKVVLTVWVCLIFSVWKIQGGHGGGFFVAWGSPWV